MPSIRWVLAGFGFLCFSTGVAQADPAPVITIEGAPTATFRQFHDREPTSADKKFSTSAIAGGAVRVQLFPLAMAPLALAHLGAYAQGAVGFLSSVDIDVEPGQPGHDVATTFWRVGAGLLYRIPLHLGAAPLAITVIAGAERWSFSFDMPTPALQLTPTARYSFARAGADARVQLGRAALGVDAIFLLPWSIDDLGDRPPLDHGWGVQAAVGASWLLVPHVEVVADARYTLFHFSLPQILPRTTESAKVSDRYLDFALGGRFRW